jgi:hypothetical protein
MWHVWLVREAACRVLEGKAQGRTQFPKTKVWMGDNIKMDLQEVEWRDVD